MEMIASFDPQLGGAIAIGVVALLVLLSMRRVPQGFEYTVERFGEFRRVLRPGLRFVLPFADRIGSRLDLRERTIELSRSEMLTRDRVELQVDAVAFFQVVDAARAAYEVDALETSLRALLSVSLRTLVGERTLDELLAARGAVNAALLAAVDDAAGVWGVHLTRTEIGDLRPPMELVAGVRDELRAELERRTRVTEAEGERRSRQLRAESERDAQVMAAQTRADVARLDAESAERTAEGDARATLMLSRALEQGSVHALNYLLARQYVEALRSLAESDNGRFVILPLENGGVAASLTGIRELAEATFPELAEEREEEADVEDAPVKDAPVAARSPAAAPAGATSAAAAPGAAPGSGASAGKAAFTAGDAPAPFPPRADGQSA